MGGGAAILDFDNDGDEDIWMAGGLNRDVLFENLGNGSFEEIGEQAGLLASNGNVTSGTITGDFDNDGYRDVMTLPQVGSAPLLFKNNGDGTFSEISEEAGLKDYIGQSHAGALGDFNLDGLLDIYLTRYVETGQLVYDGNGEVVGFDHDCFQNILLLNNGDWTFSDVSMEYGVANSGCALATTFTDFDLDADPDLLIANDFGEWILPNALYQNEFPMDSFSDISEASNMDVGLYGMGIAIGDYDQDLDLDYYVTNLGRNVFLQNQGDGTFQNYATETGTEDTYMDSLLATGWGTAFIDVDNDADLDLFVCNGYVPAATFIADSEENRNRLFINDNNSTGAGFTFEEVAYDSGLDDLGRGRGFAYTDYDNDGDLDILVINVNEHTSGDPIQKVKLFRNDQENGNNWLKVKLEGISNNRDAFGSTLKITAANRSWVHDYNGGFGTHASQHSSIAHFGLGTDETLDSLVVTWPGGAQSFFTNIPANQTITISEDGNLTSSHFETTIVQNLEVFPNPGSTFTESNIVFNLSQAEQIELIVYDALGRKIKTLASGFYPAGQHKISWEARQHLVSSSWCIIQLKTTKETKTKQLVWIN